MDSKKDEEKEFTDNIVKLMRLIGNCVTTACRTEKGNIVMVFIGN